MAPVFAQVGGDAVRAGGLADFRGLDGVRFAESAPAIARLANRGHVVNVNTELKHVIVYNEWNRMETENYR
jgi:hypothetical protein